jgi:hypothetical protein
MLTARALSLAGENEDAKNVLLLSYGLGSYWDPPPVDKFLEPSRLKKALRITTNVFGYLFMFFVIIAFLPADHRRGQKWRSSEISAEGDVRFSPILGESATAILMGSPERPGFRFVQDHPHPTPQKAVPAAQGPAEGRWADPDRGGGASGKAAILCGEI